MNAKDKDKEFELKLLRARKCTDMLAINLKDCISALIAEGIDVNRYDRLNDQFSHLCDEMLPLCEIMKKIATGLKEAKQGIISSDIKQ